MADSGDALARGRSLPSILLGASVFALAAWLVYGPIWRAGADSHLPVSRPEAASLEPGHRADVIYEAWLVSRHADTLPVRPWRLFDTPHCAPLERSLTLGIPMATMGVLAIPAWWITGDPFRTWNATLVLLSLAGALAMYLLVAHWTGVPGAAIASGLLYGFHPIRLTDISHPSVWDATWTVLALFFAERWFATGRWRDSLGLVAATLLQVGASFYTLLGATFGTPPLLAWLVWRDGLRRVRPAQIAFVASAVGLGTALLLGPYLVAETSLEAGLRRQQFVYATVDQLAPAGPLFLGFSVLILVVVSLIGRRGWMLRIHGDPRLALVVGALLAGWVALGDDAKPLPDLHGFFSAFLPGLDSVRVLARVYAGTHLLSCVLAGLGAAALIRLAARTPRFGRPAAIATAALLVLACGIEITGAPTLGIPRPWAWGLEEVEVDPQEIAFFAELERLGNDGPILELPLDQTRWTPWLGPPRILMTLYHGRRTSACFGSYTAPGREALLQDARKLPAREAIEGLLDSGFTTVVVRHPDASPARGVHRRLLAASRRDGSGISRVHHTATISAFALSAPQ